jgi:threonine dehydrogenase-like Zn-dependent dehydrogenase
VNETAEALWYVAGGRAEIRPEALPPASDGSVRVQTLFSALSRGTERLIFSGKVPEAEYDRMRGPNMGGAFPFPVKYGYSVVGRVEEGPPGLLGRTVFALHPHQTVFTIPADQAVPVSAGVTPERATLAANMETALNAIWDAAPGPADRIAIVGGGTVGALCAWLCRQNPGAEVTLVDIDPARARLTEQLGVAFAKPQDAPKDCDLVVHASASPAGLSTALSLAGNEATVLELSWYGAAEIPVPLGQAFHSRRLRLVSSQVGQVAPSHRPRWTHRRRLQAALQLLQDPALDALLAPSIAFQELPQRLPGILDPASGVLCQLIRYPER